MPFSLSSSLSRHSLSLRFCQAFACTPFNTCSSVVRLRSFIYSSCLFPEQIGFLPSYILSAALTALLITAYSARVLQSRRRAYPISALLVVLYGYLYFVLQLEDYALLFGSLLLFALLATVMYLTRNVNWFEPAPKNTS